MTRRTTFLAIAIVIALVLAGLVYAVTPDLQLRTLTQAELGLASVFVALLATVFSFLGVIATWRTVQEMKLAREAQERPYVIMDFDLSDPPIINLVLSNIGNGAAKGVKFRFEPDLVASDDRNISKSVLLFRDGIKFFAPGKTISVLFDMSHAYLAANKPLTFNVTISYRNAQGTREYKEFMELDLSMFKGRHYIIRKGIHDLVKEIEKLNKEISRAIGLGGRGVLVKTPEDIKREREELRKVLEQQREQGKEEQPPKDAM